jgi:hypothetical protein
MALSRLALSLAFDHIAYNAGTQTFVKERSRSILACRCCSQIGSRKGPTRTREGSHDKTERNRQTTAVTSKVQLVTIE